MNLLTLAAAHRLVFSRSGSFHRAVSLLSVLGIAIAVAALLVVLAVVNGFRSEFARSLLSAEPNVVVRAMGRDGIQGDNSLPTILKRFVGVADAAPFLVQEVLIASGKRVAGGVVRGVKLDSKISRQVTVLDGAWPPTADVSFSVALGRDLAARLGASVGDTVALATFLSTDAGVSFSLPRVKPFQVCALLDLGIYQYNNSVCFTELSSAQEFYRMEGQATGIEVKVMDPFEAEAIAEAITDSLGYPYYASSWQELNRPMFSMLALQKKALFLVLTLMVVVAAANVISGLTALVSVRQREIGILMAMGVTRKGITAIFMVSGLLLGSVGLIAGFVTTALLVAFANGSQLVHLAADVYQIDHLPLKLELPDILLVCVTTFAISTVSTLLPSRRAGRLLPIEILRYE